MNKKFNISINIAELEDEYENLQKYLNTVCHFYRIPTESFDSLYKSAYVEAVQSFKRSQCIGTGIHNFKTSYHCYRGYNPKTAPVIVDNRKSLVNISKSTDSLVSDIVGRMVHIRYLVDEASLIPKDVVSASTGAYMASSTFDGYVKTHTGWSTEFSFIPGVAGANSFTEEAQSYYGGTRVYAKFTYEIDHNWIEDVYNTGIRVVDIGGKNCLPLWANEIKDHELLDDDVRLFESEVLYTKVPYNMSTNRMKPSEAKNMVFTEPRIIAVQSFPASDPIITTGKDKSWAIRTMKGRMKKKMLKAMGI